MPKLQRAPTREYRVAIMDSHRWDGFKPRDGDVVVATYSKCGTTWTQRIVDLLIFQNPEPRPVVLMAPWLDATIFAPGEINLATLEAQNHRRAVKSHMPFDSLPVWDTVKYIHTARDGRDACMSLHNHFLGFRPEIRARFAEVAKEIPGSNPPQAQQTPEDPREFYLDWIAEAEADVTEGFGVDMPFFEFENTYWRERHRPNLLFVHYNDLKADLDGEMRRIARFLDIEVPEAVMPELVQAARFESMKRDGAALMPIAEAAWDHGADRFLHKGTNGRWQSCLTEDDVARYEAQAKRKWSPAHDAWIRHGRLQAGEPRELPD